MNLPSGHAKQLFIGFICAIGFLTLFTVLVAYNTEAESSNSAPSSTKEYPVTVAIPTPKPQETITFYEKLGFRQNPGLSGGLDTVCMEKEGTPYRLEICHNKYSETGSAKVGASAISLPVPNLTETLNDLNSKGISFLEPKGRQDGVDSAALRDPNGLSIRLFQR